MRWVLAAVLAVAPLGAQAQGLVAEWWASSASVEPEYAWSLDVSFYEDGAVAVRRCTGYETEGPACKQGKGKVSVEVLNTIRDAADAAGVAKKAPKAAPDDEIPIGGGSAGGAVWWQGERIVLPDFPVRADVERVNMVLTAIRAAVPEKLDKRFFRAD